MEISSSQYSSIWGQVTCNQVGIGIGPVLPKYKSGHSEKYLFRTFLFKVGIILTGKSTLFSLLKKYNSHFFALNS